jgi:hypothetical protein
MRRRGQWETAGGEMTGRMGRGQDGIPHDVLCIRLAFKIKKGLYKEKGPVHREKQCKKKKPM